MALVTCSECGGKVSSDAAACPHCGKPQRVSQPLPSGVIEHPRRPEYTLPSDAPPRKRMGTGQKVFWSITLPIVAFVTWALLRTPSPEEEQRSRARDGIAYCWQEQARKSHTPATARLMAEACEGLEERFRRAHGINP